MMKIDAQKLSARPPPAAVWQKSCRCPAEILPFGREPRGDFDMLGMTVQLNSDKGAPQNGSVPATIAPCEAIGPAHSGQPKKDFVSC
jgi:hypothetical protein